MLTHSGAETMITVLREWFRAVGTAPKKYFGYPRERWGISLHDMDPCG